LCSHARKGKPSRLICNSRSNTSVRMPMTNERRFVSWKKPSELRPIRNRATRTFQRSRLDLLATIFRRPPADPFRERVGEDEGIVITHFARDRFDSLLG